MKIIIFGLGSIGRRHARLLNENYDHKIYAFRHKKSADKFQNTDIKMIYSWEEVDKIKPDIAFVTNPTYLHIKTALECANRGMHLFIEKPLSDKEDHLLELQQIVNEKKLKSYVAYCLRFHPVITFLKDYLKQKKLNHARIVNTSYLPEWRANQDFSSSYSRFKDKGGGVILDLSHEIDYIEYIFGEITQIKGYCSKVSDVTEDAEDFADFIFKTENVYCNLHLDFFSKNTERKIYINLNKEYIESDLINHIVTIKNGKGVTHHKFETNMDEVYKKQLEYFFNNTNLMNSLGEAIPIFKTILKCRSTK